MTTDLDNWIKRADEVLSSGHSIAYASEQMHFATSFLASLYGPESPQVRTFRTTAEGILKFKDGVQHNLQIHARSTIRAAKAEAEAGLIKNIRALIAGENITEFLALAKEVMRDGSEASKNVGAVWLPRHLRT